MFVAGGFTSDEDDGEGRPFDPAPEDHGWKSKMLGWIPGISDAERKQAVLVDSDSDAGYDDDNEEVSQR